MTRRHLMFAGGLVLGILMGAPVGAGVEGENGTGVYGRVRITVEPDTRFAVVQNALEARFAPAPGREFSDVRIISVRRREDDRDLYEATIYDYAQEQGFDLVLDARGKEIGRTKLATQPDLSLRELDDAIAIVRRTSPWAEGIAAGTHQAYQAMPPIRIDKDGRRLVNVGVMARPAGSWDATEHEVVSVHVPTGDVLHNPGGAPETSLATLVVCGPNSQGCGAGTGSCGSLYHFEWPVANPVWKFDAMHPSCTTSVQSSGTGLELQNVKYKDKLVLKRADVPVLNVLYAGNTCGPYRDWLYSEDCFTAVGTPVGTTGFEVGSGTPLPSTFCEQGIDAGNFLGVQIQDQGNSLWLLTETNAGWYRYVMEWRLDDDGTIEPIFGFGATSNSCTCNLHTHHAYWRFEWAIDGNENDYTTGINVLERRVPDTDQWTAITQETSFSRPAASPTKDWLRIRNPQTGAFYTLYPGSLDGSAEGDPYAKGDTFALAYNTNEINDQNSGTDINLAPWINGEALGASKRLVLWYRAGYVHDVNGGDTEPCELVGPKLVFRQPCQGLLTLTRGSVGCSDSLPIELDDSDLANAGTATVTVRSTTEPGGETATLAENPPHSGHFVGSFPTTTAPAAAGDGLLSVASGDTVSVDYLDASACGTPNVTVTRTASVDCVPPTISNVQVANITESSATITWTTNEAANSSVLYGSSPPPTVPRDDLGTYVVAHSLDLTGLTACSTEYFQVTSADAAGNSTTDTNLGAYYGFQAYGRGFSLGPDDVEGGTGAWTATGTAGTLWHIDTCRALSPTHAWKAGASTCPGAYGNSADTYLTSAPLDLGPAGHGRHLRFKEFYATQSGADYCRVQVSTDGGATWTTLAQNSGSSVGWLARDYDLSSYAGSAVLLRFWFHSNGATTGEGWYLDDLDVSRIGPCGASLVRQAQLATDSCAAGGGGDAVLDPGEDVVLQVTARNTGLLGATTVSAVLTTTTPGITITNPSATFPDVAGDGGTAASNAPGFSFTVGTSVPCGTLIDFVLHFTADQGAWDDSLQLRVGTGGSGLHTYASTDTPKAIQDNTTITSALSVVNPGTVGDVNVTVNIAHTYDSDLDISLVGPNGTRVLLSSSNGGSADNYTNTTFDDQAATAITSGTPPFTGSFRPQALLSALNGIPASGTWTLEVGDHASLDTGTLLSWSLAVVTSDPFTCSNCNLAPPGEVSSLEWTPASTLSLDWATVSGASSYDLYRGDTASLPALADGTIDSCLRWTGSGPTTGAILTETPPYGSFYWYLVAARNGAGAGGAGSRSAGPRVVNSSGTCP